MADCPHLHRPFDLGYHPGGTCFRVETMTPSTVCMISPTEIAIKREISPVRWLLSGGSLVGICRPCVPTRCPLDVEGEGGLMNDRKSGPCPTCRRLNQREGFGPVKCKECGLEYRLVMYGHWPTRPQR